MIRLKKSFNILIILLFMNVCVIKPTQLNAQELTAQRVFSTPQEALKALKIATQAKDKTALSEIFGPKLQELLTGDPLQDKKNAQKFADVLAKGYNLVYEGNDKITIEIGPYHWPMPIPLVKAQGAWYFDTAAGQEEIINRHIGKDEIYAIGACHAFVTSHQDWSVPQPFHGYYFKILPRQSMSSKAFTLVAYPVYWDHSGIMTFMVNQDNIVYQRNLGPRTVQIASRMKRYNPDHQWSEVIDENDK